MTKNTDPKSSEMIPMMSENLFRQVFGDKKYRGYASAFNDPAFRKKGFNKLIRRFINHLDELVVSEKFKEYLGYQLEYLRREIARTDLDDEAIGIVVVNLKIIATFLGYHYASGPKREEPYFVPSIWAEKQGWLEPLEYYKERDSLIVARQKVVEQLLKEGKTYSEISFILNISGYKVAQIVQKVKAEK